MTPTTYDTNNVGGMGDLVPARHHIIESRWQDMSGENPDHIRAIDANSNAMVYSDDAAGGLV